MYVSLRASLRSNTIRWTVTVFVFIQMYVYGRLTVFLHRYKTNYIYILTHKRIATHSIFISAHKRYYGYSHVIYFKTMCFLPLSFSFILLFLRPCLRQFLVFESFSEMIIVANRINPFLNSF